jgi:CheY-like chemotaxis protein
MLHIILPPHIVRYDGDDGHLRLARQGYGAIPRLGLVGYSSSRFAKRTSSKPSRTARCLEQRLIAPVRPLALEKGRSLTVLLVEDLADNRLLVQSFLKNVSCHVDVADDGIAAIGKFSSGRYDLVLTDKNRYTATKSIRQWQQEQGRRPTPIAALTAYVLPEEARKAIEAGCDHPSRDPS